MCFILWQNGTLQSGIPYTKCTKTCVFLAFLTYNRFSASFLLKLNTLSKTKYNWRYERNIGLGMQAEDAAVVAFGLDGDGLEQLAGDFNFEWNIFNTPSKEFVREIQEKQKIFA